MLRKFGPSVVSWNPAIEREGDLTYVSSPQGRLYACWWHMKDDYSSSSQEYAAVFKVNDDFVCYDSCKLRNDRDQVEEDKVYRNYLASLSNFVQNIYVSIDAALRSVSEFEKGQEGHEADVSLYTNLVRDIESNNKSELGADRIDLIKQGLRASRASLEKATQNAESAWIRESERRERTRSSNDVDYSTESIDEEIARVQFITKFIIAPTLLVRKQEEQLERERNFRNELKKQSGTLKDKAAIVQGRLSDYEKSLSRRCLTCYFQCRSLKHRSQDVICHLKEETKIGLSYSFHSRCDTDLSSYLEICENTLSRFEKETSKLESKLTSSGKVTKEPAFTVDILNKEYDNWFAEQLSRKVRSQASDLTVKAAEVESETIILSSEGDVLNESLTVSELIHTVGSTVEPVPIVRITKRGRSNSNAFSLESLPFTNKKPVFTEEESKFIDIIQAKPIIKLSKPILVTGLGKPKVVKV